MIQWMVLMFAFVACVCVCVLVSVKRFMTVSLSVMCFLWSFFRAAACAAVVGVMIHVCLHAVM